MGVFRREIKRKDGSVKSFWYARLNINGKDTWKSVGEVGIVTKAVAQARLEELKRMVRLGQLDMIEAKIPTLSEFSEDYLSYVKHTIVKRSWRRDEISVAHLCRFFGDHALSSITPKDILDYQSRRLKDGAKPATVNRELACLKTLLNFAKQRSKFFGENPVSKVRFLEEDNQIERVLTPEEEERLIAQSPPHLRPIIVTAIHTGMRKSEIISLKWPNVDLEHNVITVERTNTKTKRLKRIPINTTLRGILLEQKLKTGSQGQVFLNSRGNPYGDPSYVNTAFENACRRADIKGLRFHDLRHTAATRMVESGANIVAVSKILGHSNLTMTMRYSHPESSLKDAVEKLAKFTPNCSNSCSNEKTGNKDVIDEVT